MASQEPPEAYLYKVIQLVRDEGKFHTHARVALCVCVCDNRESMLVLVRSVGELVKNKLMPRAYMGLYH